MERLSDLIAAWVKNETWRIIAVAPNYAVSSWGRVRGPRAEFLKPSSAHGYSFVSLSTPAGVRNARIHKLVAVAFLGDEPFDGAIVAHNDGVKSNCRVDNIRWATGTDNQRDRVRHGTHICGSEVAGAKLTEADIPSIRCRIAAGERYPTIAEDYGVSVSTICLIKKNKTWRSATGAAWRISNDA